MSRTWSEQGDLSATCLTACLASAVATQDRKVLVAGHNLPRQSQEPSFGAALLYSKHFDAEAIAKASRILLLGNDPFPRVSHNIGELEQP